MSNTPCISVIMAAYNAQAYLPAAVESVLGQTYPDFEFLIIDDGSRDRTNEILTSYLGDERIRLITLDTNEGLIHALNLGLVNARGRYVARMDADDISMRHRFEQQVTWLDQHADVGVLGSAAVRIDGCGRILERMVSFAGNPGTVAARLTRGVSALVHSTIMARRSILGALGGYRPQFPYAEDYDLWLRVLEVSKIALLPKPLVYYRSTVSGIRFTKVAEAAISHAYALDCYDRRQHGQAERTRAAFVSEFDSGNAVPKRLWSLTLEALLIGDIKTAATLNTEVLRQRPDYRPARMLGRLMKQPTAELASTAYRNYRRARGFIGSTRVGFALNNLRHLRS